MFFIVMYVNYFVDLGNHLTIISLSMQPMLLSRRICMTNLEYTSLWEKNGLFPSPTADNYCDHKFLADSVHLNKFLNRTMFNCIAACLVSFFQGNTKFKVTVLCHHGHFRIFNKLKSNLTFAMQYLE